MLQAGRSRGSILDEVIGFFNSPNLFSRTMALGSTQPLTEMSTRNFPAGKGRLVRKADNSPQSLRRLSRKCGILDVWQSYGLPQLVTGIKLSFYLYKSELFNNGTRGGKPATNSTASGLAYSSILKIEATCYYEMPVDFHRLYHGVIFEKIEHLRYLWDSCQQLRT
jgi:hypothetical protein